MKSYVVALVVSCMLACGVSSQKQIPPGSEIMQCQLAECPNYNLAFYNKDYEIRKYEAIKWVCTSKVVPLYSENWTEMAKKLMDYAAGKNDQGKTMAPTAPGGSLGESLNATMINVTICFYIPAALHDNTPVPTDKDVYIVSSPAMSAYVRAWSGFSITKDYAQNIGLLLKSIGDPSKYVADKYPTATYVDLLHERRNEVWAIATGNM